MDLDEWGITFPFVNDIEAGAHKKKPTPPSIATVLVKCTLHVENFVSSYCGLTLDIQIS